MIEQTVLTTTCGVDDSLSLVVKYWITDRDSPGGRAATSANNAIMRLQSEVENMRIENRLIVAAAMSPIVCSDKRLTEMSAALAVHDTLDCLNVVHSHLLRNAIQLYCEHTPNADRNALYRIKKRRDHATHAGVSRYGLVPNADASEQFHEYSSCWQRLRNMFANRIWNDSCS